MIVRQRNGWPKLSPNDGSFCRAFQDTAKGSWHGNKGITFLEKYRSNPRNSLTLFDRYGKKLFTYSKVHTCAFDAEKISLREMVSMWRF